MTDEQKIADLLDGEWHDEKPHHAGLTCLQVERRQLMKVPPINQIRLLKVPAKADEQNKPVRSREAQIEDLTSQIFFGARNHADGMFEAKRHIQEAEARGAAEQRRKDGEGQEIAGWRFRVEMCVSGKYTPWALTDADPSPWIKASGCHDRYQVEALHTHPANVAALEARVKELEAEAATLTRKAVLLNNPISGDHYEKPDGIFEIDLEDSLSGVAGESSRGDITQVTSWRKLGLLYILNASDDNVERYSAFSDRDEAEVARAALTREGGRP